MEGVKVSGAKTYDGLDVTAFQIWKKHENNTQEGSNNIQEAKQTQSTLGCLVGALVVVRVGVQEGVGATEDGKKPFGNQWGKRRKGNTFRKFVLRICFGYNIIGSYNIFFQNTLTFPFWISSTQQVRLRDMTITSRLGLFNLWMCIIDSETDLKKRAQYRYWTRNWKKEKKACNTVENGHLIQRLAIRQRI